VYGLNTHGERPFGRNSSIFYSSKPWLVSGDFNKARFTNEKIGAKALKFNQLSHFNVAYNSVVFLM